MILHHEGIQLQKGYEPLESFTLKEQTDTAVTFGTLAGDVQVSAYAPGILRLRSVGGASQPDYGILQAPAENLRLEVSTVPGGCLIKSGRLTLELLNGPMRIRFHQDGK